MSKRRTFRPGPVRAKHWPPIVLFGLITAGLLYAALVRGNSQYLAPAGGAGGLLVAALWLAMRNHFPGKPTLIVDTQRLTYRRGGTETSLAWKEVSLVTVDFLHESIAFVPVGGGKRIVVHHDMITDGGERFDMVLEDYWKPPRRRGPC